MIHMIAAIFLGGVTVVLPAESTVRGTEVSLGEVARVSGPDAAQVDRVRAFDLGYSPTPGYTRVVRRERLLALLEDKYPEVELTLGGEERCLIQPEVEVVAGQALAAAARQELEHAFSGRETELRLDDPPPDVRVPAGEKPATLRAVRDGRPASPGKAAVGVQILVDGELYQTVWTGWSVELWETHPVLTRSVMRGEALSPAIVETRRVRLGAEFRGEPLAASALLGSVAVRDLAAGSVLFGRDVQRQRLVERGDLVSIEVRRGTITARTTAIAQQDGRRGDRVRVQATTTGRELVGVVVSKELVEIRLQRGHTP